jgi:hypothetical protein
MNITCVANNATWARRNAHGLTDIYGISLGDQPSIASLVTRSRDSPPSNDVANTPLDEYVIFTRNAIASVLRLIDSDQQFSLFRSIRSSVGEESWGKGKATRKWTFTISESDFSGLHSVRVRSILAFAQWAKEPGIAALELKVPRQSNFRGGADELRSVDQSRVPTAVIGNVSFRESVRQSDLGGSQVLFNCAPMGEWTVEVVDVQPSRTHSIEGIEDIQVQIQVVAQFA